MISTLIIILLITLITLITLHIGLPIFYYLYMKNKEEDFEKYINNEISYPLVSIIVPTYNEEKNIKDKIDDILSQNYPKDKIEIILVDSNSTDKTVEIASKYNVKILKQEKRMGKANALNYALANAKGEIIIITDADSKWVNKDAIKISVNFLNNKKIGAVTCIKKQYDEKIEKSYRDLYNVIRLGESSIFSTSIAHGEFFAFKKEYLTNFDENMGADDSYASHKITLNNLRSLAVKEIICNELVPKKGYFHWRVRRAQHLVQYFSVAIKDYKKIRNKDYKKIILVEYFLHLINPWLLLLSIFIGIYLLLLHNLISIILFIIFLVSLISKTVRTWILTQIFLIIAQIKNLYNKEIIWEKEEK